MRFLLPLLLLAFLFSCTSQRSVRNTNADSQNGNLVVEDFTDGRDITDYLRTVTGVKVFGDGASANISIRGINSFNSTTEPLFVLDGQTMGNGMASVYSAVNINDIQSIRVLKDAGDLGIYGVRGANGVIEITLKR